MEQDDNLLLARITNDAEWNAYRKLVEAENKRRGIEAEPLPEERPQTSASTELNLTIGKAIKLWQRHQPLESIKATGREVKAAFSMTEKQLKDDGYYHYQNARTYLENTLSGAASIVEDTLGLSSSYDRQDYFVDPEDFLNDELTPEPTELEPAKDESILNKMVAKGTEDIAHVEQAIYGFFNQFRGR